MGASLDEGLIRKLEETREGLAKEFKCFPRLCCAISSLRVKKELELPIAWGYFTNQKGLGEEHAWNYIPELGLIVDLTANQFFPGLPDIYIIMRNSKDAEELYFETGNSQELENK